MREVTEGEFKAWRESVQPLIATRAIEAAVWYSQPDLTMYRDNAGTLVARVAAQDGDNPPQYWLDESQLSGGGPEPADSAK